MNLENAPIDITKMAASIGNLGGKVALITGKFLMFSFIYIDIKLFLIE